MKGTVCAAAGLIGAAVTGLFGGWDAGLTTLCILMGIDYLSGLICAGVFHVSPKSDTGALKSDVCFRGLVRKGVVLLLVLVAHRLDLAAGMSYLRDGVCIAFTVSEAISIVENAGLMGVPVPPVLLNGIDALRKRRDERNNGGAK